MCDYELYYRGKDKRAAGENEIDLRKSDYTLFSEANSMFEIKYKNNDIKVEVRTRN